MKKTLFDRLDPDFYSAVKKIYVDSFKEEQKKLQKIEGPKMELKSEEEILGKVEEEIITGLDNVDPFEFAKEILARKYGVKTDSIRRRLPASFTKRLRSLFKDALDERSVFNLVEDVKNKEIQKKIDDLINIKNRKS